MGRCLSEREGHFEGELGWELVGIGVRVGDGVRCGEDMAGISVVEYAKKRFDKRIVLVIMTG